MWSAMFFVAVTAVAATASAKPAEIDPDIPSTTTVVEKLTPLTPLPPRSVVEAKNPFTAVVTSVVATLGGIGLVAIGAKEESITTVRIGLVAAFIGPTAGHLYARNWWNAGLGIRLASMAVAAGGAGLLLLRCFERCGDNTEDLAGSLFVVGGLGYIGGTLYEIGGAATAASRYNREHDIGLQVTAAPIPHGAGLHVSGRF